MKVGYLPRFVKDLKKLKKQPIYSEVKKLAFNMIPEYTDLSEISNLKKLKGENNTYRIRVGDYRIGLFIDEERIIFARVLHRKDIYKKFP